MKKINLESTVNVIMDGKNIIVGDDVMEFPYEYVAEQNPNDPHIITVSFDPYRTKKPNDELVQQLYTIINIGLARYHPGLDARGKHDGGRSVAELKFPDNYLIKYSGKK